MDEKKLGEIIGKIDNLEEVVYNLEPNIMVRMDDMTRNLSTIETVYATTSTITDHINTRLDNIEAVISNLDQKLNRIMKYLPDGTKLALEVMEGEDE